MTIDERPKVTKIALELNVSRYTAENTWRANVVNEQIIWMSHWKTKQQGALEFCFDVFHANVSENATAFFSS